MTRLMEHLLEDVDASSRLSLLFTEKPFLYQKFRVRVIDETRFCAPFDGLVTNTRSPRRRLDPWQPDDAALLDDLLRRSTPLSSQFSPTAYAPAFHLNCYANTWKKRIYYHPDWHAVLVFAIDGQTLWLYAILALELPTMGDIVQAIGAPSLSRVVADFCPNRFGDWEWRLIASESSGKLMVQGTVEQFPLAVKYPEIAKF